MNKRTGKKGMAWLLAAAMAAGSLPSLPAQAAPETVAGGYEIDMEDLPISISQSTRTGKLCMRRHGSPTRTILKRSPPG